MGFLTLDIQLGVILWFVSGIFYFICTLYYVLETMPAYIRHRSRFVNPKIPSDKEIKTLLSQYNQEFPLIKFQITSKGNEIEVVKRGIKSIATLANKNVLFSQNIELLIVTDESEEISLFKSYFKELNIIFPTEVINVPQDYQTPNKTEKKARSLHYSLEHRKINQKSSWSRRSFIFYLDAESTIDEKNFRRILHSIITSPDKKVLEGPIIYPHKYFKANLLSRQMEATRPFHCHHCVQVMKHPPPIHLHGSNLLVEEKLVMDIGWDFGRDSKEQPLLAEDLIFGLKTFTKYGKEVFSWHGGEISEQPPFTIRESVNARLRWISGAWQAISVLKKDSQLSEEPWRNREWPLLRLKIRIITHSLTFIAALFVWFTLLIFIFPSIFHGFLINPEELPRNFRAIQLFIAYVFFLPGSIFWIFSIVNGLAKNIKPLKLPWRDQVIEYCKVLIVTPIAGAIESFCAFYATLRWIIGRPYTTWHVTTK